MKRVRVVKKDVQTSSDVSSQHPEQFVALQRAPNVWTVAHSPSTRHFEMVSPRFLAVISSEESDNDLAAFLLIPSPTSSLSFSIRLDLDSLTDEAFFSFLFRFDRAAVLLMLNVLTLPERVSLSNGSILSTAEAMLRRFACPGRCGDDLQALFCRQRSEISMGFNYMVRFMHRLFSPLLKIQSGTLPLERLRVFAAAVVQKGSSLPKCVGFIDGTVRGIARPAKNQRDFYNGHKRKHSLEYQGVVTLDGIFVDVYGPIISRRYDMYLVLKSKILPRLERTLAFPDETFYLYGDPAYVLHPTMQVGFKGASLSQNRMDFNVAMSAVRVTVEWGFANVVNLWAFLDMKRSQKIGMSPVGLYYPVGMLLANMHNCTRLNQISQVFRVQPPALADYIRAGLSLRAE